MNNDDEEVEEDGRVASVFFELLCYVALGKTIETSTHSDNRLDAEYYDYVDKLEAGVDIDIPHNWYRRLLKPLPGRQP